MGTLTVNAVLESLQVGQEDSTLGEASLHVNIEFSGVHSQSNIWLILVADNSGSMSGNPWKQVQGALKCICNAQENWN